MLLWHHKGAAVSVLAGGLPFDQIISHKVGKGPPGNTMTTKTLAGIDVTRLNDLAAREARRFQRYDKDRDSRISRDEYLASRRKAYAKLDTNGDGRLSFDEWVVRTATKFSGADRDRSGTLSASEFATTAVKRKARARCVCPPASADE